MRFRGCRSLCVAAQAHGVHACASGGRAKSCGSSSGPQPEIPNSAGRVTRHPARRAGAGCAAFRSSLTAIFSTNLPGGSSPLSTSLEPLALGAGAIRTGNRGEARTSKAAGGEPGGKAQRFPRLRPDQPRSTPAERTGAAGRRCRLSRSWPWRQSGRIFARSIFFLSTLATTASISLHTVCLVLGNKGAASRGRGGPLVFGGRRFRSQLRWR
jgi:hypothetical protein